MSETAKQDSMDATMEGVQDKLKATALESASQKRALSLIDLPPSVRNNIYKYSLDTELVNTALPNVSYTHTLKDGMLHFKASRPPFPVETSLFYLNKSTSVEAVRYFYSNNLFVRFETYTADARHAKTMLETSGILFSTASPRLLERFTRHALELVLVEKNSSQQRAIVMFPAQYLPRLINFFDQASRTSSSWAPQHTLFANLVNTFEHPISRLQGDLLEPLRLLSNLGGATIDSKNLLPRYAEGLQASMTAHKFKAEHWLATVTEVADLADAARDRGDYTLANEYAQAVIIALTYGYLTHPEALHNQTETFTQSIQRLRWRTELGIGISLSLLHRSTSSIKDWLSISSSRHTQIIAKDLLLAESSLSKALSLATDSPSPSSNPWFLSLPVELIPNNKATWFTDLERAQTWYALGITHAALGEHLFAAGDVERALVLWSDEGGKEKVEEAFEKIRSKIDGDAMDMFVGRIGPGSGLRRAGRVAKMKDL